MIESDPENVIIEKVQRNILADKPRITRFNINWGMEEEKTMENSMKNELENQKNEFITESKSSFLKDFDTKMLENNFNNPNLKEVNPFLE